MRGVDGVKATPITATRFFSVMMSELFDAKSGEPKELAVVDPAIPCRRLPETDDEWEMAHGEENYLRRLMSEVEKRRFFALMSMTPDKIARSSAAHLMSIVQGATGMLDTLNDRLALARRKCKKEGVKKDKLSDDEERRIKQLVKSAG